MEPDRNYLNIWGGGQLLAFSGIDGPTDFERGLTARTAFDGVGINVKLPGTCGLVFAEDPPGQVLLASDFFELETSVGRVRGAFLDAHHLLIEGPCEVTQCSQEIATVQRENRTLVGSAARFDSGMIAANLEAAIADRRRWLESLEFPAGVSAVERRTLCKAFSQMKTQVYTPEGMIRHRWTTPDRWPHRRMWLWDSAFHAIGWRHLDVELAREMISAVLDAQREDGFVPHAISPTDTSQITQPPILAFSARLVNDIAPDPAWIEQLYPKLCAYVEWDFANRDRDGGGLAEWAIAANIHSRSGESGMDNSPRFDTATHLDAVDFNAFLALECETLVHFARLLGRHGDAGKWQAAHRRLCRLINEQLWDDGVGFYVDFDIERGVPSPVLASAGFLPLICGAASVEQARRLAAHLKDPGMFGTPLPVPSIAAKDRDHYAKDMWRGPVWINLNWLIAHGFERYGMKDLAGELRTHSTSEIEKFYGKYGTLFEFYDDRQEIDPPRLLRKGMCAPEVSPYHQVFFDYGWTATLYVDMVFMKATLK